MLGCVKRYFGYGNGTLPPGLDNKPDGRSNSSSSAGSNGLSSSFCSDTSMMSPAQNAPVSRLNPPDSQESMSPEKTNRRAWLFSLGTLATGAGAGAAYKAARSGGRGWFVSAGIFLLAGISMMFSGIRKR